MSASLRIGVLMGGTSAERDVSLKTGAAVLAALRRKGYDAVAIDVDATVPERLARERVQLAFIALHGRLGEDGAIQGLLEVLGIPYTGSGVLASALGMDKVVSRRLFEAEGLPVPRYVLLTRAASIPPLPFPVPFPVVVKPNGEGSSVGVSIVSQAAELPAALAQAFEYDRRVLIEAYIAGKEIQVGILGERALGAIEIRLKTAFYDYVAKYTPGMSEHIFPAPLPPDVTRRTLDVALTAFRALGCEGYGRVDCLVDEAGTPYVLEVNTLPGLTETSLLPDIARGVGIAFDDLVEAIVTAARGRVG
ncbi:MAG: D-alanine--D-alanine ligase [Nitrospirae bacterium]|nr:D-alanine--D-alanine ligase [Nitrospirota bacterium]